MSLTDISYQPGKFGPEAIALADKLQADAVVVVVLGSKERGSGCCVQMTPMSDRLMLRALGLSIAEKLRELAASLEEHILLKGFPDDDHDQHQQTVQQHSNGGLRSGSEHNSNQL